MSGSHPSVPVLACLALCLVAPAAADTASGGEEPTLRSCAAIAAPADRLACYDALARQEGLTPPPAPPAAAVAAPVPPAAAAQPPSSAAVSGNGATAPAAAAASLAPAAAPAPGLSPEQAFGLYNAEHVVLTSKVQSITARVVGVHTGARGYPVVDLDGGQSWALGDPDPLLAAGDTVTIRRASFDSFLLTTPTRRVHRARRLN